MKVLTRNIITVLISVSLSLAIEQSVWMPTCSTSSGNALISHPADCRKFFICIDGTPYPLSCPYGQTWNTILKKCSTVSACDNEQGGTVSKYNPLCPIDENPANLTRLPDKTDCGKFYECENGFAYPLACPAGMHWSSELDSCVDPSVAKCKVITEPTGNLLVDTACPLIDDPENPIHYPHPEDCTKFYKCLLGKSYMVSCPYGLHWNEDASQCDSPFIVQCKKKQVSMSQMSTTSSSSLYQPSSTTTQLKPNVPVCPENGVKNFGIPGQCDKYFSCSQGKLYVMKCREGREWSEILSGCVQSSLAGCTGIANVNALTTPMEKSPSNPFLPVTSTATSPTSCSPGVALFSHPTDCHKFVVCDNGKQIEKYCPDGLFFSRKTLSCQWTNDFC